MADDVDIDLDKMSLWSSEEANAYFESGGEVAPGAAPAGPPPVTPVPWSPLPYEPNLKPWFPRLKMMTESAPKFRLLCFHNAGSSESVYSGNGVRQKTPNPFVLHCTENGGELYACELPGREQRRSEKRHTTLRPYCEALFAVIEPVLKQDVPYAIVGHSMGTWMSYEFMKLLAEKGMPLPKMWFLSGFPAPNIPEVSLRTAGARRRAFGHCRSPLPLPPAAGHCRCPLPLPPACGSGLVLVLLPGRSFRVASHRSCRSSPASLTASSASNVHRSIRPVRMRPCCRSSICGCHSCGCHTCGCHSCGCHTCGCHSRVAHLSA